MTVGRQPVEVRRTVAQALNREKLATYLWPQEKLSVEEISRRLLLEHLLWQESERNLIESVRILLRALKGPRRGPSGRCAVVHHTEAKVGGGGDPGELLLHVADLEKRLSSSFADASTQPTETEARNS